MKQLAITAKLYFRTCKKYLMCVIHYSLSTSHGFVFESTGASFDFYRPHNVMFSVVFAGTKSGRESHFTLPPPQKSEVGTIPYPSLNHPASSTCQPRSGVKNLEPSLPYNTPPQEEEEEEQGTVVGLAL